MTDLGVTIGTFYPRSVAECRNAVDYIKVLRDGPGRLAYLLFGTNSFCKIKWPPGIKMRAFGFFVAGTALALTDIEHKPFMRKNIDPIVFPGKYISHMHSFYGSDAVTKDLPTTAELQAGCPSGENPNDMSVYCEFDPNTSQARGF